MSGAMAYVGRFESDKIHRLTNPSRGPSSTDPLVPYVAGALLEFSLLLPLSSSVHTLPISASFRRHLDQDAVIVPGSCRGSPSLGNIECPFTLPRVRHYLL